MPHVRLVTRFHRLEAGPCCGRARKERALQIRAHTGRGGPAHNAKGAFRWSARDRNEPNPDEGGHYRHLASGMIGRQERATSGPSAKAAGLVDCLPTAVIGRNRRSGSQDKLARGTGPEAPTASHAVVTVHVPHHMAVAVAHHVAVAVVVPCHTVVMVAVHPLHADRDHVRRRARGGGQAGRSRDRGRGAGCPEGGQHGGDEQGLPHRRSSQGVGSPVIAGGSASPRDRAAFGERPRCRARSVWQLRFPDMLKERHGSGDNPKYQKQADPGQQYRQCADGDARPNHHVGYRVARPGMKNESRAPVGAGDLADRRS